MKPTFQAWGLLLLLNTNICYAQVRGFDYEPATNLTLTYDDYSIQIWDAQMEKLHDRQLITEADNRNKDPMTIAKAGFIDNQFVFALLYRSGGGGNQLRYLIADGLSNEILLEDFQQEYSTHISYTVLHPQKDNKAIILKDEGDRNDIYEMHLNTAFAELVHEGKKGTNEYVYRIYDAMVNQNHFVYSDKISEEVWIHELDDYSKSHVLSHQDYPHQELFLQNEKIIFIIDNTIRIYDINKKENINTVSIGADDFLEEAWFIDSNLLLLINDIGDVFQIDLTTGDETKRISLGEDLYVKSFKEKGENLFLLTDKNQLILLNPRDLKIISTLNLE